MNSDDVGNANNCRQVQESQRNTADVSTELDGRNPSTEKWRHLGLIYQAKRKSTLVYDGQDDVVTHVDRERKSSKYQRPLALKNRRHQTCLPRKDDYYESEHKGRRQ